MEGGRRLRFKGEGTRRARKHKDKWVSGENEKRLGEEDKNEVVERDKKSSR